MPSPPTNLRTGRVVEKDQVDIARIIELVAPELPHSEDDQSAVALGVGGDRGGDAFALRLTQEVAHRRAERCLGETAQRFHLLLERPGSGKLGHGGEKRHPTLGDAQAPHQRRRIFAKIFGDLDGGNGFGKDWIGAFLDDPCQERLPP